MINERKEFGKKLIEIRERKGLRQADVAGLINLSQRTIGRLERGEIESASLDSLIELSKVYDMDVINLYKKIYLWKFVYFRWNKKSIRH